MNGAKSKRAINARCPTCWKVNRGAFQDTDSCTSLHPFFFYLHLSTRTCFSPSSFQAISPSLLLNLFPVLNSQFFPGHAAVPIIPSYPRSSILSFLAKKQCLLFIPLIDALFLITPSPRHKKIKKIKKGKLYSFLAKK